MRNVIRPTGARPLSVNKVNARLFREQLQVKVARVKGTLYFQLPNGDLIRTGERSLRDRKIEGWIEAAKFAMEGRPQSKRRRRKTRTMYSPSRRNIIADRVIHRTLHTVHAAMIEGATERLEGIAFLAGVLLKGHKELKRAADATSPRPYDTLIVHRRANQTEKKEEPSVH